MPPMRWFSTRWFSTTVVALLVALAAGGGAHAQGSSAYTVTDVDVDVTGADALQAILKAHPSMQGLLFDQAEITQAARQLIMQAGLEGRCRVYSGSFLDTLPSVKVDACILKSILHDWDDQSCLKILANCRRVLEPGKKLLIAEMVLPNSRPDPFGTFVDLEMLVNVTGRERTEQQYRTLFEQSGFKLKRVVPTKSLSNIIEGIAV